MSYKAVKLDLLQKLLLTDNNEVLNKVKKILEEDEHEFTQEEKRELESRKKRHLTGVSRSYTWNEVKSMARQALRK